MVSPTLPAQAGDGRHKLDAAASENSALVREVLWPGIARSHADEILSRCLHAHAGLMDFGLTSLRAFCNCAI